jgi:hypothetical protein
MKQIKVKDNSRGSQKVFVNIKRDVRGIPLEELAEKMNLKNELIDYHYAVCNEYKNVDDIEDGVDVVAEMLGEYAGSDDDFYDLAEQLLNLVKDEVMEEIYDRDENADEFERDKWDTYNSTTLPR